MWHWIFVLLVQMQPSLWCVNDLVLSQSMQSTMVCPREPWSWFPLPGIGDLSATEDRTMNSLIKLMMESLVSHWLSLGICFSEFLGLSFASLDFGRGTLLWAGLPNCWMRRGLEGCLVLESGCNYFILVVSFKGMRKKKKQQLFFSSVTVGSVKVLIWYICCKWSLGKKPLWLKKVAATYMQIRAI